MLAYALHEIHLKRGDKVVTQSPKEVFECASEKQFGELKALGAVREPTEAERALFGLVNPAAAAPAVDQEPVKETAAQRKAREKAEAAAEAARQAADDAAARQAAAEVARQAAADADGPTID